MAAAALYPFFLLGSLDLSEKQTAVSETITSPFIPKLERVHRDLEQVLDSGNMIKSNRFDGEEIDYLSIGVMYGSIRI